MHIVYWVMLAVGAFLAFRMIHNALNAWSSNRKGYAVVFTLMAIFFLVMGRSIVEDGREDRRQTNGIERMERKEDIEVIELKWWNEDRDWFTFEDGSKICVGNYDRSGYDFELVGSPACVNR